MRRVCGWLAVAVALVGVARCSLAAEFKGCYARWSDNKLVIGNTHVERTWNIRRGLLTATSLRDVEAGVEWIAKPAGRPAPFPACDVPDEPRTVTVTARNGKQRPVEEESLVVEMTAAGRLTLKYVFQVFPAGSGVSVRFAAEGNAVRDANPPSEIQNPKSLATGIELAAGAAAPKPTAVKDTGESLEDLLLAPQHLRFTQVTLLDQTDVHNELVFEREWLLMTNEAPLRLQGNVFFVENTLTGVGLLMLKQAPLPEARPVKAEWDALVTAGPRRVRLAGQGYRGVVLAYHGGRTGRILALQGYQRQLRAYDPGRDGLLLSNTWGDRSRDARLNCAFMLQEIEAGARLGVDVVQIDDGWQQGRSANSVKGQGVWNGYWAADPNFWQPNARRFPGGLGPVIAAARAKGMRFGLWYGPDSSHEVANWNRDAQRILDLHREGIDYFKIDSVKALTLASEQNLRRFFDRVQTESGGRVVFDLDVTAEIRPGYFGVPDVGPIFIENRYSDFHRYWPHQTLRNLWKLAQYVDPLRLRVEFLNNARNTQLYRDDPLAPARYSPDCLFAVTMFANPLAWCEVSNLPAEYVESVARLVQVWKMQRQRLFAGRIVPIGAAPDGTSWTGFVAFDAEAPHRQGGWLLLFRELNDRPDWSLDLPLFGDGPRRLTPLAGQGSAELSGGRLSVHIPQTLQYLWVRVE